MTTHVRYYIAYNGRPVRSIGLDLEPVMAVQTNLYFSTEEEADSFIMTRIATASTTLYHIHFDCIDKYSIVKEIVQLEPCSTKTNYMRNYTLTWLRLLDQDICTDSMISTTIRAFVMRGFGTSGLDLEEVKNLILGNPKLQKTIDKLIPKHIISNIENYMQDGLVNAPVEELEFLNLTISDEMKFDLDFEELFPYNKFKPTKWENHGTSN